MGSDADGEQTGPGIKVWAGIYDALGALQAQRLGYDALWLSSLGLSTGRLGLPDAGFLEPDTVITALTEIRAVSEIPVIVDFENGYGLRGAELAGLASRFFKAGCHGLCIEDSTGAKRNSLWAQPPRGLAAVDDMARRLAVLTDVAAGHGGTVIARTEALIEGLGVDAAVERVRRYAAAGCHGVVIHFRRDVEAVLEAARRCADLDVERVVIPTAAPALDFATFAAAGFDVYVAANVAVRAAVTAVGAGLASVLRCRNQADALRGVASLAELDALVGTAALVPEVVP